MRLEKLRNEAGKEVQNYFFKLSSQPEVNCVWIVLSWMVVQASYGKACLMATILTVASVRNLLLIAFERDNWLVKLAKVLTGFHLFIDCSQLKNHVEIIFPIQLIILWGKKSNTHFFPCVWAKVAQTTVLLGKIT